MRKSSGWNIQIRRRKMKKVVAVWVVGVLMTLPAMAGEMMHGGMMGHGMMSGMQHGMMAESKDTRISLNLPAPMRLKQKQMMREHLQAVSDIVRLIAERKFNAAAGIAHKKLGLTPEMKKMCNMFGNDDFRTMGLTFHQNADTLGDVLKTGNVKRSLNALHATMNACVQCHATFRQ